MENLIPIVVVPIVFGSIIWLTYLIVNAILTWHRRRLSTRFHEKLLERFGSSRDFGDFLSTDGGRKFVDSMLVEKGTIPYDRIMHALQWGVVLVLLGFAFVIVRGPVVRRGLPAEVDPVLLLFGSIAMAVGLGLLISAAATFVLSRRMGLLDYPERRPTTDAPSV